MKTLILIVIISLLSIKNISAQSLTFMSQKQVFMSETNESVKEDSVKTAFVVVDINMKSKIIEIINKTGGRNDEKLTFTTFESEQKTGSISYYFNSKEIKVVVLFKQWLSIQYKDGRIINYIVTKQL
ncbi:MAG: hypothetical protein A3K10_16705 [Bacteroidetes bacterium RIFCSPLOWO2_12_FULL_31_6]|nr:MAG: hypothetical protein A3K10_16705 [Bacteroidetes bacterium RIFCSPLOWO2_12_FULL_31_6]